MESTNSTFNFFKSQQQQQLLEDRITSADPRDNLVTASAATLFTLPAANGALACARKRKISGDESPLASAAQNFDPIEKCTVYQADDSLDGLLQDMYEKPMILVQNMTARVGIDCDKFHPEKLSAQAKRSKGQLFKHEIHVDCQPDTCCMWPTLYTHVLEPDAKQTKKPKKDLTTVIHYYREVALHAQPPTKIDGKCPVPPENMQEYMMDVLVIPGAWQEQLSELEKLPECMRISEETHMISNCGHVGGISGWYYYIKIPGSATTTHRENLSLLSVNINFGPSDVVWRWVSAKYSDRLLEVLKTNCITGDGNFWLKEHLLEKQGIKVHKLVQKPGDLIVVGLGTWHCVQAKGLAFSVATNLAPMDVRQYRTVVRQHTWNRSQSISSVLGLNTVSLILAAKVEKLRYNVDLAKEIKKTLVAALAETVADFNSWAFNTKRADESRGWRIIRRKVKELTQKERLPKMVVLPKNSDNLSQELVPEKTLAEYAYAEINLWFNNLEWCISCRMELWNARLVADGDPHCFKCAHELGASVNWLSVPMEYYFSPTFVRSVIDRLDGYIRKQANTEPISLPNGLA